MAFENVWGIKNPVKKTRRRKFAPNSRLYALVGKTLWRAKLGVSAVWTYADTLEGVLRGLIERYEKLRDKTSNFQRWEEYLQCHHTKMHLPHHEPQDGPWLRCQKCDTCYTVEQGEVHEINPPYDPEMYQDPGGRYVYDENWNPVPEPHLVKWAAWYCFDDRVILQTQVASATVITHFTGYSLNKPPLLYETYILLGDAEIPIIRCAKPLDAAAWHDRTVARLQEELAHS